MNTKEIGAFGEERAAEFLREHGYVILSKNFRCRLGEIDLVVRDDSFLVFVEVKLRKNASFAEAREFVTASKQQKIIKAARYWLLSHPTQLQPRFDVIEIYAPQGLQGNIIINHIIDAFQ